MCSEGSCDVAGLISGPVGNLLGIGIKALVNGAPIGPRTTEALQKPKEQENIKQFYDNVETHLKGMLQVLEPALEIKKILSGESKSAERERPVKNAAQPLIQYYSPQILRKSQDSTCQSRGCSLKKSTSHLSTEKSSSKTHPQHNSKIEKSTENKTQFKSGSSCCKSSIKSKKISPKSSRSSSATTEASYKSCCTSESKENLSKSSLKVEKCKQQPKKCCMCAAKLKDNIVLAVLPCQHLFCYTCLTVGSNKRCRKCDKIYDLKNVSQIFY